MIRFMSLGVFLALGTPLLAQQISLDWSKADSGLSCPSQTSRQSSIPVKISNLNDILFTYSVETSTQYTTADDFSNIPKVTQAGDVSACTTTLQTLGTAYSSIAKKMSDDPSLSPKQSGGSYSSVKLADTLKAWGVIVNTPESKALNDPTSMPTLQKCINDGSYTQKPDDLKLATATVSGMNSLRDFQRKVNSSHTWEGNASLTVGATNTVLVTITESYSGQPLKGPSTLKCDIQSSILSLSAGTLFSTIPARDYVSVAVPNTSATGTPTTVNELAVQDKSNLQPLAIGLLNYDIPLPFSTSDAFGLQIASGPTFRIGGTNNVSSFGYFGGLSIHFWKRFFVTPGVHVAEFADYPLGFTQNSVIPSGFGTLTPVKRWTARFGISLTYRTNSISTLGQKTTTPTPTATQTQKQNTPATTTGGGTAPVASTPPVQANPAVAAPFPAAQPPAGSAGSPGTGPKPATPN